MLSWHYITSEAYLAANTADKTSDKLFFLSDTGEIYRGTQAFTESVVIYTEEPTVKAVGKIYINSTTLEGKVWNGTAWTTVIQPVQATITTTDTAKPVSGKAVADYVTTAIAGVTGSTDLVKDVEYTAASNTITVTYADDSTEAIAMAGVAADLVYNSTSGLLQVKNASGTTIGTGVSLDLERFVSSASFDSNSGEITLVFNDESDPLNIDVSALVDTYTAANSTTISMSVTGNQFTAQAIVANTTGNMLSATENGLYVAATDITGKIDVVSDATENNVAIFDANGGVADSEVAIGGATLASSPSSATLATEAAVNAVANALSTTVSGKMTKVTAADVGEVIIAGSDGDASASGVTIGGEAFNATPNVTTLATEKGVAAYAVALTNVVADGDMATTVDAASDAKVTSEKAVVDAMTWKTTV